LGKTLIADYGTRCQLCIKVRTALNLDFSEWGDAFPNKLLGAATLDRLRHNAYRLVLDGESYRAPRSLPEGTINSTKKQLKKEVK
jgi:hypothetical protein